jgi:uncharacterized alpha-E superfamily protein
MLSRTADHLFWMARYIERADRCAAGAAASKADESAANVKRAQRAAADRTRGRAEHGRFSAFAEAGDA